MPSVCLNNKIIDEKDAAISVRDRGFTHGDGLFETMKAVDGKILFFDEHMNRMSQSMAVIKIKKPHQWGKMLDSCHQLLQKNRLKNARIRITLSRGVPKKKSGLPGFEDEYSPTLLITTLPLSKTLNQLQTKGYRCTVSDIRRDERAPISGIKHLSYLGNLYARDFAKAKKFDEAIILNSKGRVAECSMSNIFIVSSGKIITPALSEGQLPGITEMKLIEAAAEKGIKINRQRISLEKLLQADEIFVTNSVIDLVPVTQIDNTKIGPGKPGAVTKKLIDIFNNFCKEKL
jgi:branched-chain amino acid aminotransferase